MATTVAGIFAAGDAVTGPSSVAEAIGTGRNAAVGVDCYLRGKDVTDIRSISLDQEGVVTIEEYGPEEREERTQKVVGYDEVLNPDYYEKSERVPLRGLAPSASAKGFEEVYGGYSREEAMQEAGRCFHCGHCAVCGTCAEICPMDVIAMGEAGPEALYAKECWHCGGCRINCPCGAIYYEFPLSMMI